MQIAANASYSRAEKNFLSYFRFLRLEIAIYRSSVMEKHDKSRVTRIDSTMQMEYKVTDVNKRE